MDPDATLTALFEAVRDGWIDDAAEHLTTLRRWMANGGFAPTLSKAITDRSPDPHMTGGVDETAADIEGLVAAVDRLDAEGAAHALAQLEGRPTSTLAGIDVAMALRAAPR